MKWLSVNAAECLKDCKGFKCVSMFVSHYELGKGTCTYSKIRTTIHYNLHQHDFKLHHDNNEDTHTHPIQQNKRSYNIYPNKIRSKHMSASLASTPTPRSEGPPSGSSSDQLGRLPAPEVLATVGREGVTVLGVGRSFHNNKKHEVKCGCFLKNRGENPKISKNGW